MPASERPADVERMAERFERQAFRDWPEPGLTLVRCDPNIANVIRRPGSWACVDWEYSGWGDPAWDVAEIMLHPSYREVPEARWAWLCSRVLSDDVRGPERLAVYRKAMNVWWLARLSRLRYETLRGLDVRLVEPRAGWEAELEQNYEHYLRLAGRAV
jgi:thiamine kinase-like enzyme